MKDRAMQALYLLALEPVAETTADPNSYGFRAKRSTADAIEACFHDLAQKNRAEWILEGDIKGCFDHISHEWLLANIPIETTMLSKWLKAGYMDKRVLYPTEAGTPQGGIISPTLMNMALDGMEALLASRFPTEKKVKGQRIYQKVNLVRYADDFIITGCSRELLETEVKPLVTEFLATRGLQLSEEKTRVVHIDEGFDFLGQNIRKYNGKLLIKPSKKSVQAVLTKVRGIIKTHKMVPQATLIGMLNPVIRGWANYHRHVVAKAIFNQVDNQIWRAIWQWAKFRHPNKGGRWIKKRYFKSSGLRNWIFAAEVQELRPDGKRKWLTLANASDIPILRHRKIRAAANPFDPRWETYFESRLRRKMRSTLATRYKLLSLWRSQAGICPVCGQIISVETDWHVHHIVPRHSGGTDENSNLVMLHPECHRRVHRSKLTVVRPRPARGVRKA